MNKSNIMREAEASRSFKIFRSTIITLILIAPILFSCRKESLNKEYHHSRFAIDSITIVSDKFTFNYSDIKCFTHNNKEYIAFYDHRVNKFKIFTADSLKLVFSKDKVCTNYKIMDYDIHSFDTIYLLYKYLRNCIVITDTSFIPFKEYRINVTSREFPEGNDIASFYSCPLYVKDSILHVFHSPTYVLNSKERINEYFTKQIDLDVGLCDSMPYIRSYYGRFPKIYFEDYYNATALYRTFAENKRVHSFEISDTVFIYDSDSIVEYKRLKSNYFTKVQPYVISKILDFNYREKHSVENAKYLPVVYNSYSKHWYRVCIHAIKYQNDDGTVNLSSDKPWSVVVADKDFNVLKEILFEPDYLAISLVATKYGYLVQKKQIDENNKTQVTFVRYNF